MRDALVEDVRSSRLAPGEYPGRYSAAADRYLAALLDEATDGKTRGYALVAVGGYGQGALCPGSDLDVVLVHRSRRNVERVAQQIWYGIWDDGTRLDHSVRTRRDALAVARTDLKVVLGLLDGRVAAGDARVAQPLLEEVPALWRREIAAFAPELAQSIEARHAAAGELAFLLEPDLKQSAGGLRDLAALRALAVAFPALAPLASSPAIAEAERRIIAARVALHSRTGTTSDRLALQEQDEVARLLGHEDADLLMAALAEAGRSIAAACTEGWQRARALLRPASGTDAGELAVDDGIVLRGGEVALGAGARPAEDPTLVVRLALAAAQRDALIERESLERCAHECAAPPEPWPEALRSAFVELLATGDALVPVVEALDQRRLFDRLLPEWLTVRNRPQRNAYHRYTVDRHLLEAVARAAEHLGDVGRPDLLLLGALLHDIGKGAPGDHSEVGTRIATRVAQRMGYGPADVATLARVVAYHLLLPEFATRRDLDDPATATVVARIVEDRLTLELLAALTEADSRATGTAAWGPWKAELVSTLVERVGSVLDGRPVPEPAPPAPTAEQLELIAAGEVALRAHGRRVTVVAPDRPGLLAAAAGVLALHRCNVRRATATAADAGMAIEVFDVEPVFDKMPSWERVERDLEDALSGELALAQRLATQDETYARGRRPVTAQPAQVHVLVDNHTSARASIVEVRAPDRLGLLHDITAAFAALGLDVVSALVDTLGHEVIDTFYVRDARGEKLSEHEIASVRTALNGAIASSR